jgi:hypothetical protein
MRIAANPSETRHPGLVPGSTGPHGIGLSLQPFSSSQSGPRNESGVTA